MRVMVIVKASSDSEAGVMPTPRLLEEMGAFNQQLMNAGILGEAAGLKATSHGARVQFSGSSREVVKGPFDRTPDLIAGFWIWTVKSLDEAIEWARRCPHPHPGHSTHLELRPLFEEADFA